MSKFIKHNLIKLLKLMNFSIQWDIFFFFSISKLKWEIGKQIEILEKNIWREVLTSYKMEESLKQKNCLCDNLFKTITCFL